MPINEPETLDEVWEAGCQVEAFYQEDGPDMGTVTIAGNREGLRSLAKLLLYVSRVEHAEYYHVHFDKYSGLKMSSNVGLTIQKCTFTE